MEAVRRLGRRLAGWTPPTVVVAPSPTRRSFARRRSVFTMSSAAPSTPKSASALYPEIEPFQTGFLKVSDLHTMYFEVSGNPQGKPVVFVHGGPGGGTDAKQRRFFDPSEYRIVLFDQRGCGKSTPHACLEENTTWHLVSDMEVLRTHLGIDRWQVFGGSWGSTLALAYAVTHPDRVTELVLRGVFLLRRAELLFFYQDGASWFRPDAWEDYVSVIPEAERGDMMSAYYRRLTSPDAAVRQEAARQWSIWEGRCSYMQTPADALTRFGGDEFSLAFARIECHYFVHAGFFPKDGWLLQQAEKIAHIPTIIVQGRYDLVCPMKSAWDLHKCLPRSELVVVQNAGHSANEPDITAELVRATDRFRPSALAAAGTSATSPVTPTARRDTATPAASTV